MSPNFRLPRLVGPWVALLIFSAVSAFAATAVNDAPGLAPAPIVDKPLAPAADDRPGEQPTPQHAWIAGHWRWSEGAYVWESGRWEVPPAAQVVWRAPEWRQVGRGYVLREGFWDQAAPQSQPVVAAPRAQSPQELLVTTPPPPPRDNATWVPARWETRGGRTVFIDGYWRDAVVTTTPPPVVQPPAAVAAPLHPPQIVVVAAPPPLRREVVYARPSASHVWVPGYWAWSQGRHVWIAGHYARPPRGYRSWQEPRWEHRGGSHIFIEGRWGR